MNPILILVLRHGLTVLGGLVAAWAGLAQDIEGSEIELIAGSVAAIAGVGWTVYDRRQRRKAGE